MWDRHTQILPNTCLVTKMGSNQGETHQYAYYTCTHVLHQYTSESWFSLLNLEIVVIEQKISLC